MIADLPAPCFSVEVRPSHAGEGTSPGGGDLQAQLVGHREGAGRVKGAAQAARDWQAHSE
jgi:hypothetical protein